MAGIWDSNLKRLVGGDPVAFVTWLLPGAIFVSELSQRLDRSIEPDILYEVVLDDKKVLLHLEFQRYNDANMANRVLEYNVYASCKFDCTVVSYVIYLKQEGNIVEPPLIRQLPNGQQVLRFDYKNVKLWEIPTDELRDSGLVGLLPLLSLTKEGRRSEVVDEAIITIQESEIGEGQKANLLSITLTLAALAFDTKEERSWLRRRFQMYQDILRDSEIYQMIMQEGEEKGREEEHQRRLQDQRRAILRIVQAKFPDLARIAIDLTNTITDPEQLEDVTVYMGLAQTADEAYQYLTRPNKKANG